MKRLSLAVVVLLLISLIVLPVQADDRLKITRFIDNHIRATGNLSNNDRNLTWLDLNGDGKREDDEDSLTARTRGRFFFNVEAFDNTEAVMGLELDQTWGNRADSDTAGFDIETDNNNFELK